MVCRKLKISFVILTNCSYHTLAQKRISYLSSLTLYNESKSKTEDSTYKTSMVSTVSNCSLQVNLNVISFIEEQL